MGSIIINGGRKLEGTIPVSGSKNGTLPLMAACILTGGKVTLVNAPNLSDIRHMGDALRYAGMKVEFTGNRMVIHEEDSSAVEVPYEVAQTMRASIAFIGPLLARRKKAKVALPGGCIIGPRPIDLHLKGLKALGADIRIEHGFVIAEADRLTGGHVYLGGNYGSSVLATANIMMAAAAAHGQSVIEHAACEPEIVELALFLKELGVEVEGAGSHCMIIKGVPELPDDDIEFTVIPDRIEAGTYMIMGAVPGFDLTVEHVPRLHLGCVIDKLESAGVGFEWSPGSCRIIPPDEIQPVDVTTLPYPGFPTDLQAQLTTILATASKNSTITEKVYPERFMHVGELNRMGARIRKEGNTAFINGVEKLSGTAVRASDLRASAALVLAGLIADGETEVHDIHHLDRGYADMDGKLRGVGALIERKDNV